MSASKPKRPNPRVGQIVDIKFLDHCEGGDKIMTFHVYGKILKKDRLSITVGTWVYEDMTPVGDDDNQSTFNIVRSAITDLRILKPTK